MAYLLNGATIKAPREMEERNSTQFVQNRTLNGAYNRDYFGSNKRIWVLSYENIKITDYDTINDIYELYLTDNDPKTWQVTETNYTVASVDVHIDLPEREFSVRGSGYISDFNVVLTEA